MVKIDHIGVGVPDIEEALAFYRDALGIEPAGTEEVASQKVKVAFLPVGDVNIELLEGTSEESPISRFVAKKGPGIHHICFEVTDINAMLKQLKDAGVILVNETPVEGAHGKLVAFVHPRSTSGVLIELSQPK